MRHLPATLLHSAFKAYWFFTRPVTFGVKALLITPQQEVLLVRHTYQPGWHIPGGKLDRGETLSQAAERELYEEVGIRSTIRPGDLVGMFSNFVDFKHDHVALFRVSQWTDGPVIPRAWEIAEAAFFPIDKLPSGTTQATRRRLDEARGVRTADFAW